MTIAQKKDTIKGYKDCLNDDYQQLKCLSSIIGPIEDNGADVKDGSYGAWIYLNRKRKEVESEIVEIKEDIKRCEDELKVMRKEKIKLQAT